MIPVTMNKGEDKNYHEKELTAFRQLILSCR